MCSSDLTGSSGRTWTREAMLAALRAERPGGTIVLEGFSVAAVASGIVLAGYVTVAGRTTDGPMVRTRRTSLWRHDGVRWRLRHHQGTPLSDPAG